MAKRRTRKHAERLHKKAKMAVARSQKRSTGLGHVDASALKINAEVAHKGTCIRNGRIYTGCF
jgi:hypothetical protein